VKRTTGGKYDPDAHPVYFLAAGPTQLLEETSHQHVLCAVNEVKRGKSLEAFDRLLDERCVLLDSGIFNLAMTHAREHGVSHDVALALPPDQIDGFDRLWDRYLELATRHADRLWGVIELDQGGRANKPITRARIEAEAGIVPMPVYHPLLDGWGYYDDLAGEYDRLCFGNLVKASPPVRLRLIWTAMQRARAYPGLWTHLLGVTPNQNLIASSWRGSCDSSSWKTNVRWMPSWRGFSMLASTTPYPPALWDAGSGNRAKATAMSAITAQAQQLIIDTLREDTHPWL